MQVKIIAECSPSILSTFIKLHVQLVIKISVLSIFERPFYTGFTVLCVSVNMMFYIIYSLQMELVNIVECAVASVQSVIPRPVIVHHVEQEWSSSRTDVSV